MRTIALYLPAIACGAMMLAICIPMMRGKSKDQTLETGAQDTRAEIAELREEIARLKADRVLGKDGEKIDG